MEFRILGPLEVLDGDRRVALPGPRQRGLLAFLLLHANQVVSSDRLIEELWAGRAAGDRGAAALQASVSRLRKALGAGATLLATARPATSSRLDAEQLDVRRFERLVEEAAARRSDAAAAELLREALALWRGPAARRSRLRAVRAGGDRAARGAAARWRVERRIDADLALGRHAELVAGARGARRRASAARAACAAQLMLALYRAGRQAEALERYRRARQALVDELGIDPSPALQELERAILRQDAVARARTRAAPRRRSILAVGSISEEPRAAARTRRAARPQARARDHPRARARRSRRARQQRQLP